jgi:hypothetical protein
VSPGFPSAKLLSYFAPRDPESYVQFKAYYSEWEG